MSGSTDGAGHRGLASKRYVRPARSSGGWERPCSARDGSVSRCTRRRDNTHKIEEREVLYPWHPWFGRAVHVHEVIEKRAGGILRCSLEGGAPGGGLELPKWMFDRTACLSMRMAASPRVDSGTLMALKMCLADGSGAGLPLSNPSASGAVRSSCNQNREVAHAPQTLPSTPRSSRRAVRSLRSAGREAADPGSEVATAAGGSPRDGDQADGATARRPRTRRSPARLSGRVP